MTEPTLPELERELREADLEALECFRKGTAAAPVLYKPSGFFIDTAIYYFSVSKAADAGLSLFVASEESEDRMGDVIEVAGWDTKEFKKNPVFMLNHDYSLLPIGTVPMVKAEGKQLLAGVKWDTEDEMAAFVQGKYQRGIMRAVSVGFRPMEFEREGGGARFTKQELLELSAVSVPAHPHALARMMGARKFSIIKPEIITVLEPVPVAELSDLDISTILSALRTLKEA